MAQVKRPLITSQAVGSLIDVTGMTLARRPAPKSRVASRTVRVSLKRTGLTRDAKVLRKEATTVTQRELLALRTKRT